MHYCLGNPMRRNFSLSNHHYFANLKQPRYSHQTKQSMLTGVACQLLETYTSFSESFSTSLQLLSVSKRLKMIKRSRPRTKLECNKPLVEIRVQIKGKERLFCILQTQLPFQSPMQIG